MATGAYGLAKYVFPFQVVLVCNHAMHHCSGTLLPFGTARFSVYLEPFYGVNIGTFTTLAPQLHVRRGPCNEVYRY